MTFRILNAAPQYLLPDGRVNAGGSLAFYETDLSTPKGTWSDPDKTTPNTNPVLLDAAGRSVTDIWGDGAYGVVMRDAAGVAIWTRNNVRDVDNPGAVIPELISGQFLSNDGSVLAWQPILQVPDPTGSDGYILSSDGVNPIWIPQPEPPVPPEPDWDIGDSYFKLGDYFEQWGTGSAAATGTDRTSAAISFPHAFDTAPHFVAITVTSTNITGHSLVAIAVTNSSGGGCTVTFDNADRHYQGSSKIVNPVPFQWKAWGKRTDPV